MKYFAMSEQKRPNQFMTGSANPIYTEVFPNQDFASAGYALWLKSPEAHGFDVKAFDDKYVYDRSTELNWSDNASFKRFVHDLPLSPRCIPSGQAAPDIRVSDTAFTFYSNCAAYQTSQLGTSVNTLDAPAMMDTGGNIGKVPTRLLHYRYNCDSNYQNCGDEEQFFLADSYGLWQWRHYSKAQLVQTSMINQINSGTATGTLPCVDSYK
jgi:hypothetical protein